MSTKHMVSVINQHTLGIIGAAFWAAVWPDVWSGLAVNALWVKAERDHTGMAAQRYPARQTAFSSVPLPNIPSWIPFGGLGASNNYNYVECVLS